MATRTYKKLHKLCFKLMEGLAKDACTIQEFVGNCLARELLKSLDGHYSTVCISDGINIEFAEIYHQGGKLVLTREDPREWDCGSVIEFVDNGPECTCAEEEPEGDCEKLWSGVFCSGNYDLTVKNGLITQCDLVRCLPKGQVLNAAICFDDKGCLTEAATGQPLRTGKTCYNCDK